MKIKHIRNATALLTLGEHRLLLDPMLSEPGTLPAFKMFGPGRRKNPVVPLPPDTFSALEDITGVLVTHEHPDHFDKPAVEWIKKRDLPVWANATDAANLEKKGLKVQRVEDGGLGMSIEVISTRHGRGLFGWLMGPVSGYYLAHPNEPSLYITSDAVLTDDLLEAIDRLQPDVIIAPAGAANFGLGGEILFSVDELITLIRSAPGQVILNHLEAVDHCPTTRADLRRRLKAEGLSDRVHVPEDGANLTFDAIKAKTHVAPKLKPIQSPGFQKWVTAKFPGI